MLARRTTISLVGILCACFSQISLAADTVLAPPPEKYLITPGGVDMRTARYVYSQTDMAVGGEGGIAFTRTLAQLVEKHASPFGNFSHNFEIMAVQKSVNILNGTFKDLSGTDTQVEVLFGGVSQTFRRKQGNTGQFTLASHAGYGVLSGMPGSYLFQDTKGNTISFRSVTNGDCSAIVSCGYASSLTQADGTALTFGYDNLGSPNTTRLRSVISTKGYALILEYSGTFVTRACIINLAYTAMPASNICPNQSTSATYQYDTLAGDQRLAAVTNPAGETWGFVNAALSIGFIKPGYSQPWLTNQLFGIRANNWTSLSYFGVANQTIANGQSYRYYFDYSPDPDSTGYQELAGGGFTDAQGNLTTVTFGFPIVPSTAPGAPCTQLPCPPVTVTSVRYQMTPGPEKTVDPLGNTYSVDYCDAGAMETTHKCYINSFATSSKDPAGIITYYTWNSLARKPTSTRRVSVPGSGIADITRSATYTCLPATLSSCEKPTSFTDEKGATTNYTYSTAGDVLSETGPLVGGVSQQKRFSYVGRYAWTSNGAGGYVRATMPITLLNQMKTCRTSATVSDACSGGVDDEVITSYEYGPDAGPNNLLLRGVSVTAAGITRRTCYSYDQLGHKISETSPSANLASCP